MITLPTNPLGAYDMMLAIQEGRNYLVWLGEAEM